VTGFVFLNQTTVRSWSDKRVK